MPQKTSNGLPIIDTDSIDISPILTAAEAFLAKHAEYSDFARGPGRESNAVFELGWEALRAAQAVDFAMKTAGLTSTAVCGNNNNDKVYGLATLVSAVKRLLEAIPEKVDSYGPDGEPETSICLEEDELLQFDSVAIAEIGLAVQRLRRSHPTPGNQEPAPEVVQYVTLDKMAALVSKSKRTLEKRKARKANPLPDPDVPGRGGKADEWVWPGRIRSWLESEFGRKLPEQFPAHRFRDARADRS